MKVRGLVLNYEGVKTTKRNSLQMPENDDAKERATHRYKSHATPSSGHTIDQSCPVSDHEKLGYLKTVGVNSSFALLRTKKENDPLQKRYCNAWNFDRTSILTISNWEHLEMNRMRQSWNKPQMTSHTQVCVLLVVCNISLTTGTIVNMTFSS